MRFLIFLVSFFGLAGCDQFRGEFGSSGGFVGRAATKALPAVTQRQLADRYLLLAMLLAPLAMETARDGQEAKAAVGRMNALYGSLADLYEAIKKCTPGVAEGNRCAGDQSLEDVGGGYAAETLGYDVQSDLYFLAKAIVVNLDLDEPVDKLLELDAFSALSLLQRSAELFPAARRGAATFRDGMVIYSDMVAAECEPTDDPESDCYKLRKSMDDKFVHASTLRSDRELYRLFDLARAVTLNSKMVLDTPQISAIVFHINKACDYAYKLQGLDFEENQKESCNSKAKSTNQPSGADFLNAI